MTTTAELVEERVKLITQAQSISSGFSREGKPMDAEAREQVAKLAAEATKLSERIEDLKSEERMAAELAADQEVLDEQRSKTVPAEEARKPNSDPESHERFSRFLRGDITAFENRNEIAFKLERGAKNSPVLEARNDVEYRVLKIGGTGSGGAGNTVPTPFLTTLYDFRETYATVRQLGPTVITTAAGDNFEMPIATSHGAAVPETSGGTQPVGLPESQNIGGTDPNFGKITLRAFKVGQVVPLSNELIQDSGVDIERFVAMDIGRSIARREDEWFVLGTGTDMPQGIASGGFTGVTAAEAAEIGYPDIVRLLAAPDQSYGNLGTHQAQMADGSAMPSLKFFMNAETLVQVWLIKDDDDRYMFQPMLSAGMHDTLCGYGIVTSEHVPTIATGNTVMYFGAWSDALVLREAGPFRLMYSDDHNFPADVRTYRGTQRCDLRVRDSRAVKSLTMA